MKKSVEYIFGIIIVLFMASACRYNYTNMQQNYLENYKNFSEIKEMVDNKTVSKERIEFLLKELNCKEVKVFNSNYVELLYDRSVDGAYFYGFVPDDMSFDQLSGILERYEKAYIYKNVVIGYM